MHRRKVVPRHLKFLRMQRTEPPWIKETSAVPGAGPRPDPGRAVSAFLDVGAGFRVPARFPRVLFVDGDLRNVLEWVVRMYSVCTLARVRACAAMQEHLYGAMT